MTENRYRLRAGYYHNYTGIGKNKEENYTTNEVCDLLNQKDKRIKELEKRNETLLQIATDLDKALRELEKENEELHFILKQHEFAKKERYELEKEIKYKSETKNAWEERFGDDFE